MKCLDCSFNLKDLCSLIEDNILKKKCRMLVTKLIWKNSISAKNTWMIDTSLEASSWIRYQSI